LNKNRGKFIHFAEGGIFKFYGNMGGDAICIIDLRGMDAPGKAKDFL